MEKTQKRQLSTQIAGLGLNLVLGIAKLYLGLMSNSITILSDGYNNLGDSLGSGLGIIGFSVSNKKPTEKHPHGLGRVEEIVSLILYLINIFVGAYFVYISLERLFFHPPINFSWTAFGVLAATIPVKLLMGLMYYHSNKKYPSNILKANYFDCILDSAMTAMVVLSYGVTYLGIITIDAIFGIIIGAVVLSSGIKQLIQIFNELIGKDDKEYIETLFEEMNINAKIICAHSYGKRKEVVCLTKEELADELINKLEQKNIHLTIIREE